MEPAPHLANYNLTTSILKSLFKISKISLETEAGVSDQPIEVGVVTPLEIESEGHHIEEGEAGPEEVNPLPTQRSTGPLMEKELAPKLERL